MTKKTLFGLICFFCYRMVFGQTFEELNGYTLFIENQGMYSKIQYDTLKAQPKRKCLILTEQGYFSGKVEDLYSNPTLKEKQAPAETDMIRIVGSLEPNTHYFCISSTDEGTHTGGSMNRFLRVPLKSKTVTFVFWRDEYIPIFLSLSKKEVINLPTLNWKKQTIASSSGSSKSSSTVELEIQESNEAQETIQPSKTKSNYHEVKTPWPGLFRIVSWIIGLPLAVYLLYWAIFGKPKLPF